MPPESERVAAGNLQPVTYQFEVNRDDWSAWTDSIPRSKSLDERIRELLELDRLLALEDFDVTKLRLIDMKAERIANRARQGQNAIHDRDRPDQAAEKLAAIAELADSLELGVDASE